MPLWLNHSRQAIIKLSHHHIIKSPDSSKAIVVGAGIGGLAIAARLAAKGYGVVVYEQNDYPGGKLSLLEQDGYTFDTGPSLFTEPENLEQLFADCGRRLKDYLRYRHLPESCRYFYEDGTRFTASTHPKEFAATLAAANGEDAPQVERYLSDAWKAYEDIGKLFLNEPIHQPQKLPFKTVAKALKETKPAFLLQTMHGHHSRHFRHPRTVQLFDRFATYNGSNPYKAPAMLHMIAALEQVQGTFYPEGGMIAITNAVFRLCGELGVQFHFGTRVEKIVVVDGVVKGVRVNGDNDLADTVVTNTDAYYLYQHLLNEPQSARKILKQERSSSAVIFYWGIRHWFPELGLHNIFFSSNYQQEFNAIFHGWLAEDVTVYINSTAKQEPGLHAPEGCENWFVMVNAPADKGQNWPQLVTRLRAVVIEKLSRLLNRPIEPLIATESILTPPEIDLKTGSYMGSLYGTSSNSRLAAFRRHANRSRIKGLYLTGGSVHPGGGIPLCLKSAAIVARQLAPDKPNQPTHP